MSTAEMLTCQELVEIVTSYLEGAMSAAERARFEEHLDDCEGCTNYLDQMRKTISIAGSLAVDDVEPDARDRLLAAFRDWRR